MSWRASGESTVHADLVLVGLGTLLLYVVGVGALGARFSAADAIVLAPLAAAALGAATQSTRRSSWFAVAAPLIAWPLVYVGFVHVASLEPSRFVDAALARLDAAWMRHPVGPPTWPLGGWMEEVANTLYASYYVVVPATALMIARRRGLEEAGRYGVAVWATMLLCAAGWLLWPAGGYHSTGSPLDPAHGPFTAIVRALYAWNPHYAASFPSSHVAVALVAALARIRAGGTRAWLLWAAGVSFATVYGQYHYAVDTPPAILVAFAGFGWAYRAELRTAAEQQWQTVWANRR